MYNIVLCTCSSSDEAKSLANILLKAKLVACVNIVPNITSMYEWEDKICEETEFLMIIKSKNNLFSEIKETIIKNHSYDVPEVISYEIKDGSEDYLNWINKVVKG